MTLMDAPGTAAATGLPQTWSAEVDLIISALAAGEQRVGGTVASPVPRREPPRVAYRVPAELRLYSDLAGDGPWRLYTRDVSPRGVGFITPHRLPLGYGGTIELPAPNGDVIAINCTLLRCREIASGWFDGALYFNREQPVFAGK